MRKEKQLLLDDIREQIEESEALVVINYQGLDANSANEFRQRLKKTGGALEVVGKRLFKKAAEAAGLETLAAHSFEGSIGVICAKEDPLPTTKEVFEFAKDKGDKIKVVAGHFDGKAYDGNQVEALSKLPGKDEMRSMLLGLFEAPMSQTLATMEALLCSVIFCLENKAKEEETN